MKHSIFSKGSLVLALSLTAILLITACAPTSGSTVVQALEPAGPAPGRATLWMGHYLLSGGGSHPTG